MKTIFKISIHSFVDLITNSSSELFIVRDNSSVETVTELLEKLCDIYNQKMRLIGEPLVVFDDIFGTIEECYSDMIEPDWYGVQTRKGDILIHSRDDNSIPYEMQNDIETMFNAKRYHLG